jgi:methylated-DNA-protein-cysteine methyltransferase-like protein
MFDRMLAVVRQIPRGHVATYGQVALMAGYPGAARQVVWALRSAGTFPWHRVVGSGGKVLLPGQAGAEQQRRLRREGVRLARGRVAMDRHQMP